MMAGTDVEVVLERGTLGLSPMQGEGKAENRTQWFNLMAHGEIEG